MTLQYRGKIFDTLMKYYSDDAILVVKPGMITRGKEEIKKAFIAIAKYFNNSVVPTQGEMLILEAGDIALVISKRYLLPITRIRNILWIERQHMFLRRIQKGKWLCAIDNSYGTDLIIK